MNAVEPGIIQEIDRKAIEDFGFPRVALMENAGREVARHCLEFFKPREVAAFCGGGFNGGDGMVAVRHLCDYVDRAAVILTSAEDRLKEETSLNLQILKRLGVPIIKIDDAANLKDTEFKKNTLIIDALVGIGLKAQIEGRLKEVIARINEPGKKVVSVDIPSGLDAKSGKVCGICVAADMTVTFTFPKKGMCINEGPGHCGDIRTVDIGIPQKVIKEVM